jgi:hypothetical protein
VPVYLFRITAQLLEHKYYPDYNSKTMPSL